MTTQETQPSQSAQDLLAEHDRLEPDRDALRVWLNGLSLEQSRELAMELGKRAIARINEENRRAR